MSEISTQTKKNQLCAGIDTGKAWLDIALSDGCSLKRRENSEGGRLALVAELRKLGVTRVGIEATGGYEAPICISLREAGLEVQVFQPLQVKSWAKFKLARAKSDSIDAGIIAQCTAQLTELRPPPDLRLAPLAAHLTMIDQMGEDLSRARIRLEKTTCERHIAQQNADIKRLFAARREEFNILEESIRVHADLARRLDLVFSIKGVGMPTAIAMIVRMPELGGISREQAASLLGVAPFDDDSGRSKGVRHIAGGRARPRTALVACTLAAIMHNDEIKVFYDRLRAKGISFACAIIACTRKLVVCINAVLARGTPWTKKPTACAAA